MPSASPLARLLWRALAVLCLVLAVVGAFLPVLPTVPFLIAAAWAGGHGWPALERWLLDHPRFGPTLRQWRSSGAVPRRAKLVAIGMMTVSATALAFSDLHLGARIGVPLVMAAVAVWLWRRPEPADDASRS